MMLKVCGMRDPDNIIELLEVGPDLMGLIFYPKSKRFVEDLDVNTQKRIQSSEVKLVGVFVNASIEDIMQRVKKFQLDYVQLHGNEPISTGELLKAQNVKLIKVFGVKDKLPLDHLVEWEPLVDYFLFDTKSDLYGGTGKKFDWSALKSYSLKKPFLLSGGIGDEDIEMIDSLSIPGFAGIDVNSKMELSPGMKDINRVRKLKELVC